MIRLVMSDGSRFLLERAEHARQEGKMLVCRDRCGRLVLALAAAGARVAGPACETASARSIPYIEPAASVRG
jgi:hypothetical protein